MYVNLHIERLSDITYCKLTTWIPQKWQQ